MGLVWLEEVVRLQLGPGVESAAGRAGGGGDWEAKPRQLRPSPPSNALKPAKKKGGTSEYCDPACRGLGLHIAQKNSLLSPYQPPKKSWYCNI